MNPHYALVAQRAGHQCEYCRAPEAVFNFPFEVEHITPSIHGGADRESNWALSCRSCNLHKSDAVDGIDAQTTASPSSTRNLCLKVMLLRPAFAPTSARIGGPRS